ncbi:hypothetical protein ACFL59_14355 [Planctomycetota bacterium]
MEALVEQIFASAVPRRRKRLMLYALRKHTALRATEIARRHSRSPAAVTLAVRDLDRAAQTDSTFAKRLRRLAAAAAGPASRSKRTARRAKE